MGKRTSMRQTSSAGNRRIAIICGTVTSFDAISECALACLYAAGNSGIPGGSDVRIYCLDANLDNSCIHVVASVKELVSEPFYQRADIIIHHFGIMSELHLALALAPRSAHLIVQFYGVTPPHFLTRQQQHVIGESFIQIGLFEHADNILVNSDYLAEELRRIGITRPIRQLDLFGVNICASKPLLEARKDDAPLEAIYCGRFVQSKQVLAIIEALNMIASRLPDIHLTLIGVSDHSDAGYLSEINGAIATARVRVTLRTNLSVGHVSAAIAGANLLILPSLHEGFGMPVAEALAAGTPIVCSDAGSLPEVAGGFALLYTAGDTAALACAMEKALIACVAGEVISEAGTTPYPTWREKAETYAAKYHRDAFVTRWRDLLLEILANHQALDLAPAARTDALQAALPHQHLHDPAEAQLFGRFVALKAAGRRNVNPDGAIDVLHRWAFGRAVEEGGIDYWRGHLSNDAPMFNMVKELERAKELRSSSLRLRSVSGLKATLQELAASPTRSVADVGDAMPNRLSRAEIEAILLCLSSNSEFVKQAYLLILQREAEPAGLMHYLSFLQETGDRACVINQFFESSEFADLGRISTV